MTRTKSLVAGVVTGALALLAGAGCEGGDAGVPVVGVSPERAALEAADVVCRRDARCGRVETECSAPAGGEPSCEARIASVSYDECVAELEPVFREELSCEALTDEHGRRAGRCVDALAAQPCPTEQDLARWEAGDEDALPEAPEVCVEVAEDWPCE